MASGQFSITNKQDVIPVLKTDQRTVEERSSSSGKAVRGDARRSSGSLQDRVLTSYGIVLI